MGRDHVAYTTADSLIAILREVLGPRWMGEQVRLAALPRCSFDGEYLGFGGGRVLVEFDGNSHYQNPDVIWRDRIKDIAACKVGCQVVRFPYWLQLDTGTLRHFFGINHDVMSNGYPHGFVDHKATLPAAFCSAGVERFEQEMCQLPESVRHNVWLSLRAKAVERGIGRVLPRSMHERVSWPECREMADYPSPLGPIVWAPA